MPVPSPDLDTLFRQHHAELKRIAYRRLGDKEEAADIVQDAFVRYASMPPAQRLEAVESPRFFLWRIVGNLIIDLQRYRARRGTRVDITDLSDDLVDPRPTPEQILETRQQLALLQRALAELPANCRSALLLNRLEGLSHAEIAERLEVSVSMISKYIMQALRHCALRLGLAD